MSENGHAANARRRAKQQGTNPIQRTAEMEGEEVYRHIVPVKRKNEVKR